MLPALTLIVVVCSELARSIGSSVLSAPQQMYGISFHICFARFLDLAAIFFNFGALISG